jgi:hypothetical protein
VVWAEIWLRRKLNLLQVRFRLLDRVGARMSDGGPVSPRCLINIARASLPMVAVQPIVLAGLIGWSPRVT